MSSGARAGRRFRHLLRSARACRRMGEAGFSLYSSWPPYRDELEVEWFKKVRPLEEQIRSHQTFIARNRLSHIFGRKHYLVDSSEELEGMLWQLLTVLDGLIDRFDAENANRCRDYLSEVVIALKSAAIISPVEDRQASIRTAECFQRLFNLLADGSALDLLAFCNQNQAFIGAWGMPSHFAVFRKNSDD